MLKAARDKTMKLVLDARTASDLLTSNPVSIPQDATVTEVANLLTDKGISAAAVIDAAGQPVGVVSRTDLVWWEREQAERAAAGIRASERTLAREIMTPLVFRLPRSATAREVVEEMLARKVHHLFIADDDGVLVIMRFASPAGWRGTTARGWWCCTS